jgi:L-fucose mutarotase
VEERWREGEGTAIGWPDETGEAGRVLRYRLIHPPLLAALAGAGHTSQVLVADGNYPHATGRPSDAAVVYLNLRPGMVTVVDVLEVLLDAVPLEAATLMRPDGGGAPPLRGTFEDLLGPEVPIVELPRTAFYEACRGRDVACVVVTGDTRHYANILLTIGALPPPEEDGPARSS